MVLLYYIQSKLDFDESVWSLHHSYMFHGLAKRSEAQYPLMDYCLNDNLQYPLYLTRNIYKIPDIFQPNTNLIISEKIKSILAHNDAYTFLEVKFEKLFYEEYNENTIYDISCEEDLFDKYESDLSFCKKIGKYYELITKRHQDIADEFVGGKIVRIESDISVFKVVISSDMIEKYPIIWKRGHLIRKDIYDKLEKYINKEFFQVFKLYSN